MLKGQSHGFPPFPICVLRREGCIYPNLHRVRCIPKPHLFLVRFPELFGVTRVMHVILPGSVGR